MDLGALPLVLQQVDLVQVAILAVIKLNLYQLIQLSAQILKVQILKFFCFL